MMRFGTFVSIAIAMLLSACAGPSVSDCAKNSICPIVIYENFPGHFATYPDHVTVLTDSAAQTLLWTFADTKKYKFSGDPADGGDGVKLIGANATQLGVTSCFITENSRSNFAVATAGSYFRCEIAPIKDIPVTRYVIRFHATDGSVKMVDPTISSTGSADPLSSANYVPLPLVPSVAEVQLPPKTSGVDGFRVIWDAGAGMSFRLSAISMLFTDTTTNSIVDVPCSPTTDPGGLDAQRKGQYYACIFMTPKALAYTYVANFFDSANAQQTAAGKVTRP